MVSKPFGTIRQIGMGGLQLHSTRSAITDVVGEHVSAGFTGLSRAGQLRLRWGQETKLKNVASIRPIPTRKTENTTAELTFPRDSGLHCHQTTSWALMKNMPFTSKFLVLRLSFSRSVAVSIN